MEPKSKSAQLSLPFEALDDAEITNVDAVVKQNWQITFSKQYMQSVYTKRVMGIIASQIKDNQKAKPYYKLHVSTFMEKAALKNKNEIYRQMKQVVDELASVVFYIEEGNHKFVARHLLDTTRDIPVGYEKGTLTLCFNPQLGKIMNNLAHYSTYELERYMNLSSWYSMRLHEILSAYKTAPFIMFCIENYRHWMGCGAEIKKGRPVLKKGKRVYKKYAKHSDAINYTTREGLKDFKGTDLEFEVYPVATARQGKGRPAITHVEFVLKNRQKTVAESLKQFMKEDKAFERIYQRLKEFKVHDSVIARHYPVLGKTEINKLLDEWRQRQDPHSKNKIDNPERFCNFVIKHKSDQLRVELLDSINSLQDLKTDMEEMMESFLLDHPVFEAKNKQESILYKFEIGVQNTDFFVKKFQPYCLECGHEKTPIKMIYSETGSAYTCPNSCNTLGKKYIEAINASILPTVRKMFAQNSLN